MGHISYSASISCFSRREKRTARSIPSWKENHATCVLPLRLQAGALCWEGRGRRRSQMPREDQRIGRRCLALEEDGEGAEQRRPMWSPRMSPEKDACGCTTPCSSTTAHSGHDESPHPHRTRISISAAARRRLCFTKDGCSRKQAQTRRNRKLGAPRSLRALPRAWRQIAARFPAFPPWCFV